MRPFWSSLLAFVLFTTLTVPANAIADEHRFTDNDNTNQAILAARATLDLFWKVASHQPCGCSGVFLYIQYAHNGQDALLYVTEITRADDGKIAGKVMFESFNDHPDLAEDLTDVFVSFDDDDILDWSFGRDGIWYGDFIGNTARIEIANISRVDKQPPKSTGQQVEEMREKFKAIRLP